MSWEAQYRLVVAQLSKDRGISIQDASAIWMSSRTRAYLLQNNLHWVSESRCYWELLLELSNDPRWLNEPFDM